MSSGVFKRIHPSDSVVKSPSSADEAGGWRKLPWSTSSEVAGVLKRSHSTDEVQCGETVSRSPGVSRALQFDSSSAMGWSCSNEFKSSPLKDDAEKPRRIPWSLPTNIVYGPHDLVTSPHHLHWPNSNADHSSSGSMVPSSGVYKPEAPTSKNGIVTWGPAKDYIRRYMKRSISMDEDYGSTVSSGANCWNFPDRDADCAARSPFKTPPDVKRTVFKKEASSPVPSHEDMRVVTWGLAKVVPVAVKRSPSTDDQHEKDETKGVKWAVPKPISRSARRSSSTDVVFSPGHVKDSPSKHCAGSSKVATLTVKRFAFTNENSSTQAAPHPVQGLSPKDVEFTPGHVKRSLSIDSVAEPGDVSPSTKTFVKDEYYNTGLVKRSSSLDGTKNPKPFPQGIREEVLSPSKRCVSKTEDKTGKVKRSLSIDGTEPSTISDDVASTSNFRQQFYNTGLVKRSGSIDGPKSVESVVPKEVPSALGRRTSKDEVRDTGKVKMTPLSIDQTGSAKKVTWAVPTMSPSVKKSALREKRSISIDCAPGSSSMTWVPKSILKESLLRNEYYNTGLVKRSRSIDGIKSSKNATDVHSSHSESSSVKKSPLKDEFPKTHEAEKSSRPKDVTKPSKTVTWSLSEDGGGSSQQKTSLSKADSVSSKRMTRSASKDKVVNVKKEVGTTRSSAKTKVDACKIGVRPSIDVGSKIEPKLPKKSGVTSKTVPVEESTMSKRVGRTVSTISVKGTILTSSSDPPEILDRGKVVEDRKGVASGKKSCSTSKDDVTNSVELKRSASTDVMMKKKSSNVEETASSNAPKRSTSNESTISVPKDETSPSPDEVLNAKELKRTESTDAMREKVSTARENEKKLKRTPSTDTMKEKRAATRAQKPSSNKKLSTSSEIKASSSTKTRNGRKTASNANNLTIVDSDSSSSIPSISYESKGNTNISRGRKRSASKEAAGGPSKIKRSRSKEDLSSSQDSKRDSGISISEDLYENEIESNFKPKRQYTKKGKRKTFDCAICSKNFRGITDLRRHLLIHADEKPHVCEICNKSYRQKVNLGYHMKVDHSKDKEFVCRFCMKSFAVKQRLKLHQRVHVGEKPYSCPHCPKTFALGEQLQQHLKTHEENRKTSSSTLANGKSLKPSKDRHGTTDFVCQICDTPFETEKAMRTHMSSAHGSLTDFECQICETRIEEDLESHMKIHAIVRPHECEICKAVFAQRTQYNVHKRTHTGERPYQCRVCCQSFGHTNVLKLHIRKHTGEKPFKCVLCKEVHLAFSQLSHLKTHMKTIHRLEGAYTCEGCKTTFKIKFHLENHVKSCVKVQKPSKTLSVEEQKAVEKEVELLSQLRYLMAVLLKKISTPEKLAILGFEKRLIDNVIIASLKLTDKKVYDSKAINELDQMKLNIESFLEWIVPKKVMNGFKKECPSIESILEKIVSMYSKQEG